MIIYGYRSTLIGTEGLPHEKCPNCDNEGAMSIHTFSSYAHIFWIPLFPYRKYSVAHCGNCDITYEKKQMTESLMREYNNARALVKPPIWQFSGLFVIAAAVLIGVVSSSISSDNEAKYIEHPEIGDAYRVQAQEHSFTLVKVIDVKDTVVTIVTCEYVTDQKKAVRDLYEKPFNDTIETSIQHIKKLYTDGSIYQVDRNK